LRSGAAALAYVGSLSFGSTTEIPNPGSSISDEKLRSILKTFTVDSNRIGETYRALHPNAHKSRLISDLFGGWTDGEIVRNKQKAILHIQNSSREDYRASRYMQIDGWIVSLTEARINLLLSML